MLQLSGDPRPQSEPPAFVVLYEFQIRNFRCLRDVTVPLRPLTVLIGPNDSGKSAFLDAIGHLIDQGRKFSNADFWRGDRSSQIRLVGATSRGTVECYDDDGEKSHSPKAGGVLWTMRPVCRFQLPTSGVAMECFGYSHGEETDLDVGETGERIAALLDYLLRRDRKRFFDIVSALRDNIPGLQDIAIGTPDAQTRRIELIIDGGFSLPAERASAGVRLLLFFVSLAFHPRPPRTILLEEPENGIHPKRLADVMRLLRSITRGEYGEHVAQVILTTHSPYLLDCIDLEHDQVLVFRRNDDGSRTAQPADAQRLQSFLDEFMLGEIWFNQEEAGLVAKP